MKKIFIIFVIFNICIVIFSLINKDNKKMKQNNLDFYLQCSKSTNPGRYEYLYNSLPDSIAEICEIINHTLIHPSKVYQYTELKSISRDDDKFQNTAPNKPPARIIDKEPGKAIITPTV